VTVETVEGLGRVAAEHAEESAARRRLAAPIVEAFEQSGLAALAMPTALGGAAAPPGQAVELLEVLATYDASTAWCAAIGLGTNFMVSAIPEATGRELFRDVRRGGAGPFNPGAPARPDGDRVHVAGRWPYSSNCQQAGVLVAGVVLFDGEAPRVTASGDVELGLAFLSADQFQIHETWDTDGLRATGSHDVTADVHLAPDRISSLWAEKWPTDPIFRLRSFDVLGPCVAAVPLGIGRAALDAVEAKGRSDAEGPSRPGPRPRLSDDPHGQLAVGAAETRLRAARALLLEATHEAWVHGERGDAPPRQVTALIGLACVEALAAAKHAVEVSTTVIGTNAVREGSPMLRLRRDIDAAGSHIMFSPRIAAGLGREMAGIPGAAYPYLPPPDAE
jgi:alkylation response protein AidB-like acyl-CoA dehydrogenase